MMKTTLDDVFISTPRCEMGRKLKCYKLVGGGEELEIFVLDINKGCESTFARKTTK
jgi:hypothetical protein